MSTGSRLGKLHQARFLEGEDPIALRAATLLGITRRLCERLTLDQGPLDESRLARLGSSLSLNDKSLEAAHEFADAPFDDTVDARDAAAARMSEALDLLQAHEVSRERRKTGSYFTPGPVARALIERALGAEELRARVSGLFRVCDPACGGGAFLLEVARQVAPLLSSRSAAMSTLAGVDLSEVALATTEVALWLFVGDDSAQVSHPERFLRGDALLGPAFDAASPSLTELSRAEPQINPLHFPDSYSKFAPQGFDWIVGNPPWVAFQGRATQKITMERRAFYRNHYKAFTGYPTLHGLFVERATQLAPSGHITLLLPSSVSDLDGYTNARAALFASHQPSEPLPEYGQDAFEGVVQPCFGLIAHPRSKPAPASGAPWILQERTHADGEMQRVEPPAFLLDIDQLAPFDPKTFREVGFQSNREVGQNLFYRGDDPPAEFSVPLLEGRNVGEFRQDAPRLFLHPSEEVLRRTKCRLKSSEAYGQVDVVVRQTASFTIAARHRGAHFRNSLIGAFETESVGADLLVGLLNSSLYRALHVMRQRDARQAAFPQVKLSHLRKLPAPPDNPELLQRITALSKRATEQRGLTIGEREELDHAVLELFAIESSDREALFEFLHDRAPAAVRPSR